MAPEIRYRGLHRLPVYTASLALSGSFRDLDLDPGAALPPGAVPLWGAARLALAP
jgi:hypothetical protein